LLLRLSSGDISGLSIPPQVHDWVIRVVQLKPPFHPFLRFSIRYSILQPLYRPQEGGVLVEESTPYAVFWENGEVCEFVAPAVELVDDGVAEVGDEDGHCWNGD
jgi:hypothetical protein